MVEVKSNRVIVRLLNTKSESVTIYPGTKIATLEQAEICAVSNAKVDSLQQNRELLTNLISKAGKTLEANERRKFADLVFSFADVFAISNTDLGRTNKLKHRIDTGVAKPVRQSVRRIPPHQRDHVRRLLDEMLSKGVVEQSTSPWASPIVLVRKKDGSIRFCVDYRKVNEITRKDAYPLPRIDTTLDTLAGSHWFSTIDLLSGYWQVEMEEEDREKTAFCTTEGLFQFKVMPFGLCNAPATFQRLMDLVLAGLQWSQCLVYIDDVIILGRSFEEHLDNLKQVFQRLREAGLKVKPSKCAFFQHEVTYLGHIISNNGVSADPEKVARVTSWPVPKSKKEVQSFLGFANYYRRFIKNFAEIAKPLHRLTEKNAKFNWTIDHQVAFEDLRKQLSTTPVLAHPDFRRTFILDTDASDSGLGAVLSQMDENGRERVVAYGSRLLSKSERQYCVTRRELLAVVSFVKHFRPYLVGKKFVLRTDHGALTWLQKFKQPEGQLARWLEQLQELEFEIVHRKGSRHNNADALSRLPCQQCGRKNHFDTVSTSEISVMSLKVPKIPSVQNIREAQLEDSTLGMILRGKESGQKPVADGKCLSRAMCRLIQIWDQIFVYDGVLCRRYESPNDNSSVIQLLVPRKLREEVLKDLHEGSMAGHLGVHKTLNRVKERFYWPGYHDDVYNWCKSCSVCARVKSPAPRARAPLHSVKVGYPMRLVAVDILGPFPETESGNKYILVVSDYFTKWIEAYPIENQEAITVAKKLVEEFFFRFSPPEQLHSDQGRNFESKLIAEICKLLGISKTRTTPYHPQSDGLVERCNRTMLSMLATATMKRPFEWDSHLRHLCMAYNSSTHPTTGYTPFYLMFGRQVRMPIDVMYGPPSKEPVSFSHYASLLRQNLELAYENVRENMGHQLRRQKEIYDRNVHGVPSERGELVWLFCPVVPRGQCRKFHRPWQGPYKIVNKLSDVTYKVQCIKNRRRRLVVHFDRLKRCSPEMRATEDAESPVSHADPEMNDTTIRSNSNNKIGSRVELVDDGNDDARSPSIRIRPSNCTTSDVRVSSPTMIHRMSSTTTHRYPCRIRRRPAYLNDYVAH